MIAIVILGLGMLVIATMFPIAWTKAREVAEFTTATACTEAAVTSVRLLTRVSKDLNGNGIFDFGTDVNSSFLGDVNKGEETDPWVHALELGNISANPGGGGGPPLVDDFANALSGGPSPDPEALHPFILGFRFPRGAQIAFQDRVYPPLGAPPAAAGAALNHWRQLLGERRFCWSVLHQLNYDSTSPPTVGTTRTFTLYLVTLRRGQATRRYARQDPTAVPQYVVPGALPPGPVIPPLALGLAEDVQFPVPWRVEIEIVDSTLADPFTIGPAGVPGVALANQGGVSNRLVAEMMPRGAYLVDERSGQIYRVARRDYDLGGAPSEAVLTFEQEIPPEVLDDDGNFNTVGLALAELLRTVWVFPPAVERQRDSGDGLPIFEGPQPVAAIEIRTLAISP